ncbi:MAG: HAMP domain-containing protein [Bacteroidetes bacterium]|nr:HAMP domain-containing protein [Bacteroidota bacterium]
MTTTTEQNINELDIKRRLALTGLTVDDSATLKQVGRIIEPQISSIIDKFYAHIHQTPDLISTYNFTGENIEKIKQSQKTCLKEIFSGDYNEQYFQNRFQSGIDYYSLGLPTQWVFDSHTKYMTLIVPLIMRRWWWQPGKAIKSIQALSKIFSLDTQLTLEAYVNNQINDKKNNYISKKVLGKKIGPYIELVWKITNGNLNHRVKVEGDNELSHLGDALNQMAENLSILTKKVTVSSDSMLDIAQQVNTAVTAQSSGASQQASAINQTTTTLEEINATAHQNLEKATSLYEVSKVAKTEGNDGVQAVEKAIKAMQDIHDNMENISTHIAKLDDSLKQIEAITDTVDDLAQQSRMLALNASIESAKAGDAGRGFSVVADEVKELAEQSRQAAAQVKTILTEVNSASNRAVLLVSSGNARANNGAELTEQAGVVLRGLNKVINEVALSSQQIVAAIRQETAGIEQIRTAMQEINRVSGPFVKATKQANDAAVAFNDKAATLQEIVGDFKIESPYFDLELARISHLQWIDKIEDYLDGKETLSKDEAISHHHCELGEWYDSTGMLLYGHLELMQKLGDVHEQLHQFIHDLISKSEQGIKNEKEIYMPKIHSFSEKIISHLTDIQTVAERQLISNQE